MEPGTDLEQKEAKTSSSHPALTAVGIAVAIASGLVSIVYTYKTSMDAEENEARVARQTVVASVLRMGEVHREREAGYSDDILLLAREIRSLIEEFDEDVLELDPETYRQIAEYLAFSTSDAAMAKDMANRALAASPEDLEFVRVRRVLGSIAAQEGEPATMQGEFDEAMRVSNVIAEDQPALGVRVTRHTRAFRLLAAYLGATKAPEAALELQFCRTAIAWRGDFAAVRNSEHVSLIALQLRRIVGPDGTLEDLREMCS